MTTESAAHKPSDIFKPKNHSRRRFLSLLGGGGLMVAGASVAGTKFLAGENGPKTPASNNLNTTAAEEPKTIQKEEPNKTTAQRGTRSLEIPGRRPLPDTVLTSPTGEKTSLLELVKEKRVTVVAFAAPTPHEDYNPEYDPANVGPEILNEKIAPLFENQDVQFVAISSNVPAQFAKEYLKWKESQGYKFSFPYLIDEAHLEKSLHTKLRIGFPSFLLLNQKGQVVDSIGGYYPQDQEKLIGMIRSTLD